MFSLAQQALDSWGVGKVQGSVRLSAGCPPLRQTAERFRLDAKVYIYILSCRQHLYAACHSSMYMQARFTDAI